MNYWIPHLSTARDDRLLSLLIMAYAGARGQRSGPHGATVIAQGGVSGTTRNVENVIQLDLWSSVDVVVLAEWVRNVTEMAVAGPATSSTVGVRLRSDLSEVCRVE